MAAAARGAKSLLINTPNNPTGVVYSRKTVEGIIDFVGDEPKVMLAHDF
ncbi:MAG: aminotransferase class I/II-fold pyridoxal phosphate-dependent enzyme [Pseudomonadota bacterium]